VSIRTVYGKAFFYNLRECSANGVDVFWIASGTDGDTNIMNPSSGSATTLAGEPRQTLVRDGYEIPVALLTGGQDRPYAFGLAMSLVARNVRLDVIGSNEVDSLELHTIPTLRFLNLRGNQRLQAGILEKLRRLVIYYLLILRYAATSEAKIFHILWNNKFEYFDRTLLLLYYKLLGRKVVFTAHNVNAGKRDENDSLLNRLTLRIQYRLVDNIFVHTQKMKQELVDDFHVRDEKVTVLTHPINNGLPDTELTPALAKQRLGIEDGARTLLFFGRIRPYKGIEYLVSAFERLDPRRNYKLIIAGEPKKGSEQYLREIQGAIADGVSAGRIISTLRFIPDEEAEVYLKAADVLVLPYKDIFQSGVLFLALTFGLPVIGADVGSFREDIIEGRTGSLFNPADPDDLAISIERYFVSDLYRNLGQRRNEIRAYARERYSWDAVGDLTRGVYANLIEGCAH